ncbi:MAG: hypothetical protein GVY15_14570 [Bacteroidetes bacterium]|jgi:type VI secretion system protein ImpC|nr:hypothetical protein [Bacteroidota bacterium]
MSDQPTDGAGFRITSDPDRTEITQPGRDALERPEVLPLRMLLVSHLTPEAATPSWESGVHTTTVDAAGFGPYMEAAAPTLEVSVPNRVSASPERLSETLQFTSLADFSPEGVAAQLAVTAPLLELRKGLAEVAAGDQALDEVRASLEDGALSGSVEALLDALGKRSRAGDTGANGRPPDTKEDTLDRLLSMVDDDAPEASPDALADALTEAVVGPSDTTPRPAADALTQVVHRLEALIRAQLEPVFADVSFRALEAAWRSVRLLTKRLPFRKGVVLEVLSAAPDQLNEAIHHQVVMREHTRTDDAPPLSAVLVDTAFGCTQPAIDQLQDLAASGASVQAPIIAAAAPAFFQVDPAQALHDLPPLRQVLDDPAFLPYKKLRADEAARALVLALPAFLLRTAHTADSGALVEDAPLWGQAPVAVGLAMADSFVATGWPTHLRTRMLGNFPIHRTPQGYTPLAALIPESKLAGFAKGGFTVLTSKSNHDGIALGRAQTVALPAEHEDLVAATEARVHVTLPCQLFVARTAQFLFTLQSSVTAGPDVEATAATLNEHIRAFLKAGEPTRVVPPEAVSVEPVPDAPMEGKALFAVRLRPPAFVLDKEVSLVLGVQVPTAEPSADAPPST